MRVLGCGDRNWKDRELIYRHLKDLSEDTVIIIGMCRGADLLIYEVAIELGFTILKFPAEWHKYGRAAGPIRNKQMLIEGKPDVVMAFHSNINVSKGTKDMLKQADAAGVKTILITGDRDESKT